MHIDDKGYKYKYYPGDRVIVRKDLVIDRDYGSLYLSPYGEGIMCTWYPEKDHICFNECDGIVTIKDCYDGYYIIKEDFSNGWYFVDGMFNGLVEDPCLKDIEISDLDKILL